MEKTDLYLIIGKKNAEDGHIESPVRQFIFTQTYDPSTALSK